MKENILEIIESSSFQDVIKTTIENCTGNVVGFDYSGEFNYDIIDSDELLEEIIKVLKLQLL